MPPSKSLSGYSRSESRVRFHSVSRDLVQNEFSSTKGGPRIVIPTSSTPSSSPSPRASSRWYSSMASWLEKRADSGLSTFQRRYFVLDVEVSALLYFREPHALLPLAFIPFSSILLVQLVPNEKGKNGRRFDVCLAQRVYALMAETPELATKWVSALTQSVNDSRLPIAENFPRSTTPPTPLIHKLYWNRNHLRLAGSYLSSRFLSSTLRLDYIATHNENPFRVEFARNSEEADVRSLFSPLLVSFLSAVFFGATSVKHDELRAIVHDFRTESDILSYAFDVLLRPHTNLETAEIISFSRRKDAALSKSKFLVRPSVTFRTPSHGVLIHDDSVARDRTDIGESISTLSAPVNTKTFSASLLPISAIPPPAPFVLPNPVPQLSRSTSDANDTIRSLRNAHDLRRLSQSSHLTLDTDIDSLLSRHRAIDNNDIFYTLFHVVSRPKRVVKAFSDRHRVFIWLQKESTLELIAQSNLWYNRLTLPLLWALFLLRAHNNDTTDVLYHIQSQLHPRTPDSLLTTGSELDVKPRQSASISMQNLSASFAPSYFSRSPSSAGVIPEEIFLSSLCIPQYVAPCYDSTEDSFVSPATAKHIGATAGSAKKTSRTGGKAAAILGITPGKPLPKVSEIPAPRAGKANAEAAAPHWHRSWNPNCVHCASAVPQFSAFINAHLKPSIHSIIQSNALLAILVTPLVMLPAIDSVVSDSFSVFGKQAVNSGIWRVLFDYLKKAPWHVRRHTLKDITGMLVSPTVGIYNCQSLLSCPEWQIFTSQLLNPLLLLNTDAMSPSTSSSSYSPSVPSPTRKLEEKVSKYMLNIIGILHYHVFVSSSLEKFRNLFFQSLSAYVQITNSKEGNETATLIRALLSVMVQRVTAKLKGRHIDIDDEHKWPSFLFLLEAVKAFVFSLPFHQTSLHSAPFSLSSHSHPVSDEDKSASVAVESIDFATIRTFSKWHSELPADIDLLEKSLQLLKSLHVCSDKDTIDGSRQSEIKETLDQHSSRRKSIRITHDFTSPYIAEIMATSNTMPPLASWNATERNAFLQCVRLAPFFRETIVFFKILFHRASFLTPIQVRSLATSFTTIDRPEKIFAAFKGMALTKSISAKRFGAINAALSNGSSGKSSSLPSEDH